MGGIFSRKKSEPAVEFIIGEPDHSTFKHVGGHTGGDPMAALKDLAKEDDKKGETKVEKQSSKKIKGGSGSGKGSDIPLSSSKDKEQEPASEKKEKEKEKEKENHSSEEDTSYDSDEYKETPASPKPPEDTSKEDKDDSTTTTTQESPNGDEPS